MPAGNLYRRLVRRLHMLLPGARRLTGEQQQLLRALVDGGALKSHRYLDGAKVYRLHTLEPDAVREISAATVETLRDRGLITGNMKFPGSDGFWGHQSHDVTCAFR